MVLDRRSIYQVTQVSTPLNNYWVIIMQKFNFAQRIIIGLVIILSAYQLFNVAAAHDSFSRYVPVLEKFKSSYFTKNITETNHDIKVESKP